MLAIWSSVEWNSIWAESGWRFTSFPALGLTQDAPDSLIWHTCQNESLVLVTGNRNQRGEDSLEATLRDCITPRSLPVVTFANPDRILRERHYAELAAERLLDYLLNIEDHRGVGRLYAP